MDLVPEGKRQSLFEKRKAQLQSKAGNFTITAFSNRVKSYNFTTKKKSKCCYFIYTNIWCELYCGSTAYILQNI